MPACFFTSVLVRTSVNMRLAWCAWVVQIFEPLTMYLSPSRTARVFRLARSEPAPGSEKPWHQ